MSEELTAEQQAALDAIPFAEEFPVVAPVVAEEPPKTASVLETLGQDEPLYEGGPTRSQVEEIKLKYPHSKVLCVLFADGSGCVYRTMTRLEWKAVQKLISAIEDPDQREDTLFTKICLFPDCSDRTVLQNMPAGAVQVVMQEFYAYSAFQPVAESIQL